MKIGTWEVMEVGETSWQPIPRVGWSRRIDDRCGQADHLCLRVVNA
jgi:hypothetical protein